MATTRKNIGTKTIDVAVLSEAIAALNSRIEKTESDFISHLQKVEDRLDQLVELTKTVALLQQQANSQTDQITEIRSQIREETSKYDSTINKIFSKLEDIQNHQRDRLELYSKEIDIKIAGVAAKADNTDKELRAWLNRGWGAWVVGVLVFGAVQTGFYRWIDSLEKDKAAQWAQIQSSQKLLDQTVQRLENLDEKVRGPRLIK